MREQGDQRGVFYELCSMIIHFLKLPPLPITFPNTFSATLSRPSSSSRVVSPTAPVSPAAFASLFLGISLALMLFGSVAFVIGFILMPLVTLLVFLFYFVYILSNLSEFGRSFLCPPSSEKDVAAKALEMMVFEAKFRWELRFVFSVALPFILIFEIKISVNSTLPASTSSCGLSSATHHFD